MTNFFAERTDCAQYLGAVVLIVPFWIQRAFAFRTLVLRAFEAPRILVIGTAACFTSWITFARGMAGFTACVAHSVRTRGALLAMPRLRTKRTITRAIPVVGSMRIRSTVGANHRVCDPMIIRFRFLLDSLRSGLAWTSAARPLLTYAAALLGPPLPGPYLLTYLLT